MELIQSKLSKTLYHFHIVKIERKQEKNTIERSFKKFAFSLQRLYEK
jgi:hypothetical protein